MARIIQKIVGSTTSTVPSKNNIYIRSALPTSSTYDINLNASFNFQTGDEIYFINDFNYNDLTDDNGNKLDSNFASNIHTIWGYTIGPVNSVSKDINKLSVEIWALMKTWLENKGTILKFIVGAKKNISSPTILFYTMDSMEIVNDLPANILINNKFVKSMSFAGVDVTDITIEGHDYNFSKDITITQQEVEDHIKAHTTWATTGTIDTTAKLKDLSLTYSLDSNITDGELIDATVIYDNSVSNTLNGGISNVVFSKISIVNPDRTVVEADVTSYIDANINWNGTSGNLDVTKWPALHPGTKLYIADLHMVDATEYTFTVQADHGYTVNGGASFDVKYTVYSIPFEDYAWNSSIGDGKVRDQDDVIINDSTNQTLEYYDNNDSLITSDTTQILKDNSKIFTANYPENTSQYNNNIYWAQEAGIYKDGTKIYTNPYNSHPGVKVSKTGNIYYIYDSKNIYKNGTLFITYNTDIDGFDIDSDENIIAYDDDKLIYKNSNILYTLSSYTDTLGIDKNNDIFFTSGNKFYKNNVLLKDNFFNTQNIRVSINNDVYVNHRDGLDIYRGDKVIKLRDDGNYISFAIKNEYGSRTGNW